MMVPIRRLSWALLAAAVAAVGCSSSAPSAPKKQDEPPAVPVGFHYDQPKSKTDPNIVEETDSYYVRRYKKTEMVKVDDKHVRPLVLSGRMKLPIYREDDTYY